jgi:dTDP-4-amino-4,6-dideoxygalactose transaminase
MTELSAAIGLEQLKKIDAHVGAREGLARRLNEGVGDLAGLTTPRVRPGCRHVSYLWSLRVDERQLGVSRSVFSRALEAEGFPHFTGYVRPLYLLPLFRKRQAFGRGSFPFDSSSVSYAPGLCPVAERLYERELLCFENCMYAPDEEQVEGLIEAVRKVRRHCHRLPSAPRRAA